VEREELKFTSVASVSLICFLFRHRFGRKRTLMIALFMQIVSGTVISFNPWFELYLVLRFFLGFASVSVVFSAFVLCELYNNLFLTLGFIFNVNFQVWSWSVASGERFLAFHSSSPSPWAT
jgi:MFS family permease